MATLARLELELVTSLAKFQTDMGRAAAVAEKTAKRIENVMNGVGGALAGLGAAMAFKSIIDEAGEAEQALKQLQQTIRSTGGVAGVTVEAVTKVSSEIQKLTGVSDDAVNAMASVLLTFTKVGKEVFPEATKAIVDLSVKFGGDLKASAIQVGKALNDPIKGIQALSKAGVTFTEQQKGVIKSLVEHGDILKAQKIIIREIQTEMGGAAAAARDTLKGALDALNVSAKDVLENIGSAAGTGLRGAIEFMIQVFEQAAEHGKELSLALQGVAAGASLIIGMRMASELAGLAKMIVTVTAAGGAWAAGLAVVVGALVAFRNEQATLIGSTKTWGQLTVETLTAVGTVAKPIINGIIEMFIQVGTIFVDLTKLIVTNVAKMLGAFDKTMFGGMFSDMAKQLGDFAGSLPKVMMDWAKSANKQSAAAGKDYVGNFFNPILKLAGDAKKRMEEIGEAAKKGAANKVAVGDMPDVETKAEKKARLAAEKAAKHAAKEHEQDQKSLDGILATMKQTNDELALKLQRNKELIPELEAQNKLAKLGHLTEKERSAAMAEINKLAAERKELEKQNAIKDEGEKLAQMLENYKSRTQEIINAGNKQNELNVSLKAQAEIDKIIKVGKGENLELVNQILAAAKEQEKILREQKRLESLEKYGSQVQDLEDQNRQMALKVSGQEAYLPLLEQEKKIREIMKDQNLSDSDKSQLIGQVQSAASQTVRYNQALEAQDQVLKQIKDSSASTTQKIASLQMAFASGQVNVKQYNELIQDLHKEGFEKLKKDAKEFSDVFVNGFDKLFDKGTKFKDVLKDMGKEVLKLGMKKIVAPAIENIFTGIGSKLFGGAYGLNKQNPTGLPQFGGGAGGVLAGTGTIPTSIAEGPAIVGLLQQIVSLMGGNPGAVNMGGMGLPMAYSDPFPVQQIGGGAGGGSLPLAYRAAGGLNSLFFNKYTGGLANMFGAPGRGVFNGLAGAAAGLTNMGMGFFSKLGLPGFATGGFLGAGQWGIAGERGPELIYGGNSGMSIIPPARGNGVLGGWQQPWQQQNVYAGGRGGYSGNGMISQYDYANTMADLMQAKYDSGVRAFQSGDPNAPSWYQLQEILAAVNRYKTTVANGGYTGQLFSRAQFEMSAASADFNEAAYQWGGQRANVANYIYSQGVMQGYNPGAHMNSMSFGLQSSGMGQGDLILDAGTIDRNISTIAPTDPNRASAFSNPYNGGAPSGGSYVKDWNQGLGPLRDWQSTVARVTGGGAGGTTTNGLSDMNSAWYDMRNRNLDVTNAPPGAYINRDGKLVLPPDNDYRPETGNLKGWENYKYNRSYNYGQYPEATTEDRRMIDAMNRQLSTMPPAAMSFGGGGLPFGLADFQLPPALEATLGNAMRAHEQMQLANPVNFLPSSMAKNAGMNAAAQFAGMMMSPSMYRGSGDFSGWFGQASQSGWFNKSMSPLMYGEAAKLFGGRAMRHGGLPHRGEPLIVGEAGAELFVPSSSGRVVPNSKLSGMSGGSESPFNVTINTHTATPVKASTRDTGRGLEVIIEDAIDLALQRSGPARSRFQSEFDVRRRPVPRS